MPGTYDLQKEWIKMFGGLENDRFVSGNFHNNTLNIIGITNQQSFGTALETPWFLKIDTSGNLVYEDTTANFTHIENVSHFNNDGSSHILHSDNNYHRITQLNDFGQIAAVDTIWNIDGGGNCYAEWSASMYGGESERSQLILSDGYYFLIRDGIGITKLNSNFDVLYDYTIGGSSDDFAGSIVHNSNSIYVCGTTESNDGDISVNNGMKDIWVVKLSDGTSNLTELTTSKTLIQILDLMGRETSFKPNTPLIYVYDDGSTEKVFSVEY
jgi:hypothetical protein